MIRRIELVNFMSHARTVIEPADGLTVLVGPNNCGKSAVVAALQILCHNDKSTYVTRHDQKEASVTVETSDGHVVTWRRKNAPKYEINGATFDRLSHGGVPDGLHAVLRMPMVSAEGGQEFDVHFGEQKSPVFLLDKPGSHAAQFFASSSDAAKFVEMQKRHQAKMADARRERTQWEAKAAALTTTLAALDPLDALEPAVLRVELLFKELESSTAAIERLAADLDALRRAGRETERFTADAEAMSPLRPPPSLADPTPLGRHLDDIRRTAHESAVHAARAVALRPLRPAPDVGEERVLRRLVDDLHAEIRTAARAAAGCRATAAIAPPPPQPATDPLQQTIAALTRRQDERASAERRLAAVAGLTRVPAMEDETTLAEAIAGLTRAAAATRRTEAACRALGRLTAAPVGLTIEGLERCVRDLGSAVAAASACERSVAVTHRHLEDAAAALRQWAERQEICPTCGGAIDADRLIARHAVAGAARG